MYSLTFNTSKINVFHWWDEKTKNFKLLPLRKLQLKTFMHLCGIKPHVVSAESSESHANVLKAFQSLEPGDFTGFLKILRSPSSQRLQSRCTAFLNTMEAYHVLVSSGILRTFLICFFHLSDSRLFFVLQHLPVQKQSDLVQDFYQSFAEYFSGKYRLL